MARVRILALCGIVIAAAPGPSTAQPIDSPTGCPRCDALVLRIEGLLPLRPFAVRAITEDDPVLNRLGHSPEHVDGFVITGDPIVYLRQQGSTFQLALNGVLPAECALAAIVWHEMAHQRGAAETEAQVEEENLWAFYVSTGLVDRARGAKYLDLLVRRRGTR